VWPEWGNDYGVPQAAFQCARCWGATSPDPPYLRGLSMNTQDKKPPDDKDFTIKINTRTGAYSEKVS